jgi:hypothetical protein
MKISTILAILLGATSSVQALERPGIEFKIFQFPPDQIPRIDGQVEDWAIVPKDYIIGMNQLSDTVGGRGTNYDRADLDVQVRVGWVKGLNQLYFLYEAFRRLLGLCADRLAQRHFRVGRGRRLVRRTLHQTNAPALQGQA